jgi:hypothetical protein
LLAHFNNVRSSGTHLSTFEELFRDGMDIVGSSTFGRSKVICHLGHSDG